MSTGTGIGNGYGDGAGSGYGDGYGSGYGSGDGYGYGFGNGNGNGYGDGAGIGYGDGYGSGYGSGDGYGTGNGNGNGTGFGNGSGNGYGTGYGSGYGYGYGSGYGNGTGFGNGYGSGTGYGNGSGTGYGTGYGSGYGSGYGYGYGSGYGSGDGYGYGFGNGNGNGYGDGAGIGYGDGYGTGFGNGSGYGNGGCMRQSISIALYFDKGYIGDPYFPSREQLINIQKISGMNRTKSEDKRQQALKDYLQRQGMSQEEYQALEREAHEPWYRNGTDIIIPSHQFYGCLIEACRNASATLRPCDPDNLRHVLTVSDLHTGKTSQDGLFQRLVMPKSGTGQTLSNQRALRENPYIADFTATGTLAYFPEDLRSEGQTLYEFLAWAGQRIGVGASRKMGYGRFAVARWESTAAAAPPQAPVPSPGRPGGRRAAREEEG